MLANPPAMIYIRFWRVALHKLQKASFHSGTSTHRMQPQKMLEEYVGILRWLGQISDVGNNFPPKFIQSPQTCVCLSIHPKMQQNKKSCLHFCRWCLLLILHIIRQSLWREENWCAAVAITAHTERLHTLCPSHSGFSSQVDQMLMDVVKVHLVTMHYRWTCYS